MAEHIVYSVWFGSVLDSLWWTLARCCTARCSAAPPSGCRLNCGWWTQASPPALLTESCSCGPSAAQALQRYTARSAACHWAPALAHEPHPLQEEEPMEESDRDSAPQTPDTRETTTDKPLYHKLNYRESYRGKAILLTNTDNVLLKF